LCFVFHRASLALNMKNKTQETSTLKFENQDKVIKFFIERSEALKNLITLS